jgi:hypothetical protein
MLIQPAKLLLGPTWVVVGAGGAQEVPRSMGHTPQGSAPHSLVICHAHVGCSAHCKERRHNHSAQRAGCVTLTSSPAFSRCSAAGAGAGASAAAAEGVPCGQA